MFLENDIQMFSKYTCDSILNWFHFFHIFMYNYFLSKMSSHRIFIIHFIHYLIYTKNVGSNRWSFNDHFIICIDESLKITQQPHHFKDLHPKKKPVHKRCKTSSKISWITFQITEIPDVFLFYLMCKHSHFCLT